MWTQGTVLPRRPEAPAVREDVLVWALAWLPTVCAIRMGDSIAQAQALESERPRYVSQCYFFLALWPWTNYLYCLSSSFGKMRIAFWGLSEVIDVKSPGWNLSSQLMVGWLFPSLPLTCEHQVNPSHAMQSEAHPNHVLWQEGSKFFIPRVPNLFVPKIPTQMLIKAWNT